MKKERQNANEKLSLKEKEEVDEFKVIEDLKGQIVKIEVKKSKIEDDLNDTITSLWNEYELTPNSVEGYEKPANIAITTRRVNNLKQDIRELGSVNVDSMEEYKNNQINNRLKFFICITLIFFSILLYLYNFKF